MECCPVLVRELNSVTILGGAHLAHELIQINVLRVFPPELPAFWIVIRRDGRVSNAGLGVLASGEELSS